MPTLYALVAADKEEEDMDQITQQEFTAVKQAWNRWASFAHEHGVKIQRVDGGYVVSITAKLDELKGA